MRLGILHGTARAIVACGNLLLVVDSVEFADKGKAGFQGFQVRQHALFLDLPPARARAKNDMLLAACADGDEFGRLAQE